MPDVRSLIEHGYIQSMIFSNQKCVSKISFISGVVLFLVLQFIKYAYNQWFFFHYFIISFIFLFYYNMRVINLTSWTSPKNKDFLIFKEKNQWKSYFNISGSKTGIKIWFLLFFRCGAHFALEADKKLPICRNIEDSWLIQLLYRITWMNISILKVIPIEAILYVFCLTFAYWWCTWCNFYYLERVFGLNINFIKILCIGK